MIDSETENRSPRVIDDELWERLLELTDGAAAPCYQCGVCTASCPWGLVREETVSVRELIRRVQLGVMDGREALWLCTACAQCEASCPRGVPIAKVIRGLRCLAWERREALRGLPSALWSVYWNDNPLFQPPSERSLWAQDLDLPAYDPDQHEILFYVGCTPSYDRRAQRLARALVSLFQAGKVKFGVLGDQEPCCGESVLSFGHKLYFEELAAENAETFTQRGVRQLVTISPHCYHVFHNHYPRPGAGFEALHFTQFLAQQIRSGRLSFERESDRVVSFQDPCFLGRWNQVFDAPREILKAIPGLRLVEMEHSGQEALCCGGGGGRMWMETPPEERFSNLRIQEALDCGADVIATACPFCLSCLEDSLKAMRVEELEVLDVAELAAAALGVTTREAE